MMIGVTRREVESWPLDEPFALWPHMQAITLEVVMRAVFGPIESDELRRLRKLLEQLTEWVNNPRRLMLLATAGPRWIVDTDGFRAAKGPVERAVLEEIRRRRAHGTSQDGDDIFAMLERAHATDGVLLSERDMQDELITLLLDGPTSTSLAWVFERLLRHPEKHERLREELLAGEDAYLDAVVKETLRLCPPVPVVVRKLAAPMPLGSYTIPAAQSHSHHTAADSWSPPRSRLLRDRAWGFHLNRKQPRHTLRNELTIEARVIAPRKQIARNDQL